MKNKFEFFRRSFKQLLFKKGEETVQAVDPYNVKATGRLILPSSLNLRRRQGYRLREVDCPIWLFKNY